MNQFAARTALLWSFGCAALVAGFGCDTSQRLADQAAVKDMVVADQQRAKGTDEDLSGAQSAYLKAASAPGLSPQMQAILKARAAQTRLQRVSPELVDLRASEMEIARTINNIEQLGQQVAGVQATIQSLKSSDPTPRIAEMNAQIAAIDGAGGKAEWTIDTPNGKVTVPTVGSIKSKIDTTAAAIDKNKTDTEAQQKMKADALDQAETLTRKSEGETGNASLQDTLSASKLRQSAGVADAKVQTLMSQLASLQAQLDAAKTQQTSVDSARESLNDQIKLLQDNWTKTQAQIDEQKKAEQLLINGGEGRKTSIADQAQTLQKLLADSSKLRQSISDDLEQSASEFKEAGAHAITARSEINKVSSDSQGSPAADIWKSERESFHPFSFGIQQATVLQMQASVAAEKTVVDLMISDLMTGYQESTPTKDIDFIRTLPSSAATDAAAPAPTPIVADAGPAPVTPPADSGGGGLLDSLRNKLSQLGHLVGGGGAPSGQPSAVANAKPATSPSDSEGFTTVTMVGLSSILTQDLTGFETPKAISDLKTIDADARKKIIKDVEDRFAAAVAQFTEATANGDSSAAGVRRNDTMLSGRAVTYRKLAEFEKQMNMADSARANEGRAENDERAMSGAPAIASAVGSPSSSSNAPSNTPATMPDASGAPTPPVPATPDTSGAPTPPALQTPTPPNGMPPGAMPPGPPPGDPNQN